MKTVHKAVIVHLTPGMAQIATLDNDTRVELDNPYVRRHKPKVGGTIVVFENCELGYIAPEGPEAKVSEDKAPRTRIQLTVDRFSETAQHAINLHLEASTDPQHFIDYVAEMDEEEFAAFQKEMEEEAEVLIEMKPGDVEELLACDRNEIEELAAFKKEDPDGHQALADYLVKREEVNGERPNKDHTV